MKGRAAANAALKQVAAQKRQAKPNGKRIDRKVKTKGGGG